jgi:hypothetical protein
MPLPRGIRVRTGGSIVFRTRSAFELVSNSPEDVCRTAQAHFLSDRQQHALGQSRRRHSAPPVARSSGRRERHHDRGPRGAAHGAGILARRRHSDGHPHRVPRPTHRRPQDIVRTVRGRGAVLRATEQPIDTGKAAGKCFLDMLGVFAEFETNLRRERQLEGIAKAKAAGVYKGRPPSIEASRVRELRAQGMRPSDIARRSRSAGRPSTGF